MTRSRGRSAFLGAAIAAGAMLTVALFVTLTPKPVPYAEDRDVAIAKLDALTERVPQVVVVPELKGLDRTARELRIKSAPYTMGSRAPRDGDLAVLLVRYDGQVRGFIALDPRNSCDLKIEHKGIALAEGTVAFHDVCHGSLYDVYGSKLGGPTPWALDELVLSVRDGVVYADRRHVLPGRLLR